MLSSKQRRLQQAEARTRQLIGEVAVETDAQRRAIRLALGEVLDGWLTELPEDQRAHLFATLEARASTRQRCLIAAHPARPIMDGPVTDGAEQGETGMPKVVAVTPLAAGAARMPRPANVQAGVPTAAPVAPAVAVAANDAGPEGTPAVPEA